MKQLVLFFIILITFTNVSYASFPITENQQTEIVEEVISNSKPGNNGLSIYGLASLLLIGFVIAQIFVTKKWINLVVKTLIGLTIGLFLLHTLGLISRWLISGNAPWSNAYESIIYVAWTPCCLVFS